MPRFRSPIAATSWRRARSSARAARARSSRIPRCSARISATSRARPNRPRTDGRALRPSDPSGLARAALAVRRALPSIYARVARSKKTTERRISRHRELEENMKTLQRLVIGLLCVLASTVVLAQETITIGFTVSQTGPLNLDSIAQLHGFEMWRDDVNAAGGIKAGDKRYKVRFVSYDDQSQPGRVQQLYTRLIVEDKAQFLFSPYSSGLVATATIISEQYGKLMMSIGGAEPKTYQLGNKYLFQTYTPADHYLTGALELVKSKNPAAKIALVYSDDPFSKAVAIATREQSKQLGFSLVLDESYPPNQTDFSAIINKIISSGADTLLGGGHYPDGATLARQLHDQKANLKWVTLLVAPDSP